MLLIAIAVQLLPATVLLAWLATRPLRSVFGCLVQILATAALCWVLVRVAVWLWPSYWTPWLLVGVWLVASARALWQRFGPAPFFPLGSRVERGAEWFAIVVLAAVGVLVGSQALDAERGRTPPPGPLVDLAPPFASGRFLIGHGGSTETVNPHLQTLAPDDALRLAYRGQSHALDILKLDALGRRATALQPSDPAAYHIFDEPVLAPCAGVVRHVRDGLPDMPVPERDRDNLAGNFVIIDCTTADVVLAHLRLGSVQVEAGDRLEVGDRLARVGNSGNTSEPHLHIHAQTPGTAEAPLSGEPLPITIDGRYLVRNDRLIVP